MPISRMQQPRQMYGLGSFVKKAVKGFTGAVKDVAGGIKDLVGSDAGKLALLGAGLYGLGGAKFLGGTGIFSSGQGLSRLANLANLPSALGKATGFSKLGDFGKTAAMFAGGSLLGGVLGQAEETGDPEGITRNVGALKTKLADAYRNQRTFADAEDEEAAIAQQVERDVSEYTAGPGYTNVQESASFASGGRVQYGLGSLVRGSGVVSASMNAGDTPVMSGSGMGGMIAKLISSDQNILRKLKSNNSSSYSDFIDENFNGIDDRKEAAMGGRMKYALGTPEQNAFKAARLEGLPLNQNPAGVSELDLRESGGFIPPVGVKEKADDIPAMLSNNEFVFTADAVRNMGDGNVNKGAQRMYDFMKYLENGGRV